MTAAAADPDSTPSRPLTRAASRKRASAADIDAPATPSSPSAPAPPPAKRTRRAKTMPAVPAPVVEEPAAEQEEEEEEPAVELPPASAPAATHSANNNDGDDEDTSDLSDIEVFEARISKLDLHGSPTKAKKASAVVTTPARATRSQTAAAAAAAATAHADSTTPARASPSPTSRPTTRSDRAAAHRKPDATPSATAVSKPPKGRKPKPKPPAAAKSKPKPSMSPVESTPTTANGAPPHPATPSPGPSGKRKLDDRVQALLEEAQARARDLDADLDAMTAQLTASHAREAALQADLDRVRREMHLARDHDRGARHRVHQLEVDLAAEREVAAGLRKKAETLETQLLKAEAARAADVKVRGAYQIDLSPTKVAQAMDDLGLRMPVVVRAIMKEQARDVQTKVDELVVADLRTKAAEDLPQFTLSKSQRDKYLGGAMYRVLMAQFASPANPVTAQIHALANAFQTLFAAIDGDAQTAMQTAWDRSRAAVERHWAQVAMVPDLHAQPAWAAFYETVIVALRAALELRHVRVSDQLVADKLVPLVRDAARLWYLTQAVDSEWVIAFPDDVARIDADQIKADNAARLVDGEATDVSGKSVFVLFATAPMIVIGKEQDAPLVFKAEGVRLDVPDPGAVAAAAAAAAADEEVEAAAAVALSGSAEPVLGPHQHAAAEGTHAPDPLEDPMPTPPPPAPMHDDDDDDLEIMPIGATSSAATPAAAHPSSPLVDVDVTMDDLPVDRPSSALSGSQPFFTAPSAVGDLDVEGDDQDVDMTGSAGPAQPSAANLLAQLGANAMVVADVAAAPAPASGLASLSAPAPAPAPVPSALAVAEGRAFDAVLHEMMGPVMAAQAAAAAAPAPSGGSVDAEMNDVEMSEAEPLPATAPPS
ncbi:hypothetical protein GGF32_009946 [Allomyces javanicus]|nr:hypothetical protein GGF32_009946 [Allomyces javanicus]